MNIYVGNLNYQTTDEDVRQLFVAYGTVTSAKVITDKFTGRSKGFAFVFAALLAAPPRTAYTQSGRRPRHLPVDEDQVVLQLGEQPAMDEAIARCWRTSGSSSAGAGRICRRW
ncbi:MAG: hypothetical protein U1G05_04220 [Kiritimatiellia bacterium]